MKTCLTGENWAIDGQPPVAGRVAEYFRAHGVRAKSIASIIGICERSAKSLRCGEREPRLDQLMALAAVFGAGFVEYIYQPHDNNDVRSQQQREIHELKLQVARLEARFTAMYCQDNGTTAHLSGENAHT